MPSPDQVYRLIHAAAPGFADQLRAAAAASHNEAELRTQVALRIQQLAEQWGVRLNAREEYTLAEGQADAVYNRVVIEYKTPGTLGRDLGHAATFRAVEQMRHYVDGLSREQRREVERLLAVALDGRLLVFARYYAGHWNVESPTELNASSAERLLRALFSLAAGRALIPQNLVEDFGAASPVARDATRALYRALEGHPEGLPAMLFKQWQIFFSEVSGYDEDSVRLRDKQELRAFAEGMGLAAREVDPPRLLFAIHTYFSFLVKSIARLVLQRYAGGKLAVASVAKLAGMAGPMLQAELGQMERGDVFKAFGLQNLLEGDFFSWYLQAWEANVEAALRGALGRLAEYNPSTLEDDPYAARDLLKKLYHYLLPRELRHDLGEYYTPDWLAERLLAQVNEARFVTPGPTSKSIANLLRPVRLLDPACGSGTFLVLAIRALKEHCRRQLLGEAQTLELILRSVVGIDLNPLAVLAARVNYLLAVADLVPWASGPVEIPVYLADSILPPRLGERLEEQERRILTTSVGDLPVPLAVDTREEMDLLANLLEEYVRGRFSAGAFVERACAELRIEADSVQADVLRELFSLLAEKKEQGLDDIWARVLKNAFMPLFLEPFDVVVGNPPWVNWESLPEGYRRDSAHLWQEYGLFVHTGMGAILGKGKKDLSTLMTYAVAERLLKDGGKLGFVITQSVFKTAGAGQGFRRFRIGKQGPFLRVLGVDDLSELQPFEGATNRTAIFVLKKGEPTRYPVPYTHWKKATPGRLDYDSTLHEALGATQRLRLQAIPVDRSDPTSAWLTARERALCAMQKMLGTSVCQAHEGVNTGGANAVYWLHIAARRPDGLLVVRNLTEGAKREVPQVTAELEPDLVYPLLRGRDVSRWHAGASAHILMVQDPATRQGVDEKVLQRKYPKTFAYLRGFEGLLRERKSQSVRTLMQKAGFHSMFAVGDYTLAPYKVVWREVSSQFATAMVGSVEGKPVLPDHTVVLIACSAADEAHYMCASLNSGLARLTVNSYIALHPSPHVMENVRVPRFDAGNPVHRRLAELSQRAHAVAGLLSMGALSTDADTDKRNAEALQRELAEIEAQVDQAAAELWGITPAELAEVQRSLADLSR